MAQILTPPGHDVPPVRRRPRQLPWPLNLYQTAVGKKYAMAISGIALLGFVAFHAADAFLGVCAAFPVVDNPRRLLGLPVAFHAGLGSLGNRRDRGIQTGFLASSEDFHGLHKDQGD